MEKRKFVCKYCCKRFPCGKSLGGHIRTHMSEGRSNNAAADSDTLTKLDGGRKKRDLWSEAGGGGGKNSSIYGLRENPKKTIRFVHSDAAAATTLEQEQKEERFCKECGKGFSSLKALCGHMACHSEKDKKEKLVVMDSQSDTETNTTCAAPIRRSKRMMRFKSLSSSSVNVSEVEQEQEEVAMCLMLLSKDSFGHRNRFASESSDNNSVVLETKSSSLDTKIAIRHNGNNNFVEKKKLVKDTKLKSSVGVGVSNNSDSRYFRYGSMEDKSGFEDYNCELNGGNRSKHTVTVFKKLRVKDLDHDRTDEIYENGRKGWEHEWLVSERDNGCYDSTTDDENSSESDSFPAPRSHHTSKAVNSRKNKSSKAKKKKKKLKTKKSREHECPICYKIFRSGQALGGHKRSHFVGGGSEENTPLVIKQGGVPPPPPAVPCLIDLNLPAPVDE